MIRTLTNHACEKLRTRFGITNMVEAREWINKHVPQGEGRVVHGDFTFVFAPGRNETQTLVTIFRTKKR